MGGYGSGRRRESWSKETTESYRRLDIRQLKREGLLIPGAHRCITSARYGGTTFMIEGRTGASPPHGMAARLS